MAAQTPTAVIFKFQVAGSTLSSLPNPLALDLIQIYGQGGDVLISVTSTGVVSKNPASPTGQALFGRYFSRLASTASTAAIFADAFSQNNNNADILQVAGEGQNGIYHVDFTGTAFSS